MPPPSPPGESDARTRGAWLILPALCFPLYFGLLLWCDVRRPEPSGAVLAFDRDALVVRSVAPGSIADRAGLEPGVRVRQVEARRVDSRLDWLMVEMTLPLGRPVTMTLEGDGGLRETTMSFAEAGAAHWRTGAGLALAAARLAQAITLAAGLLVLWRRPHDTAGRLAAWLLLSAGVFTVVPPYRFASAWASLPRPLAVALWIPHLSAAGIGAVMAALFAVFPRRRIGRWPGWIPIWAPMLVALAAYVEAVLALVGDRPASRTVVLAAMGLLPLTGAYAIGSLVLIARGYRETTDALERRRTRIVMAGAGAGLALGLPVALTYWSRPNIELSHSLFASPVLAAGTLALLAFPLSITYAILRHRLFDVAVIIRQGVQYALARRAVTGLAPLIAIVFAVDVLARGNEPVAELLANRGWLYALLGGLAMLVRNRRQAWLDALDRRFFRERHDAQRLLRTVVDDVRRAGAFPVAAGLVAERVSGALHPTMVAVLARQSNSSSFAPVATMPVEHRVPPLPSEGRLAGLARVLQRPMDLGVHEPRGLARGLPPDDRAWLAAAGAEVLVPVSLAGTRAEALLALGPRRSEEPYADEDLDLLGAVADALGLVLDRAEDAGADGALFECASCGRCYPRGVQRCPADQRGLDPALVPQRLAGRYLVERRLGRGGMGAVYEALDATLGRRVAIKVLRDELAGHPSARERFEREARALAALSHPNIVIVHDYGIAEGDVAYLVMERLEGTTLRERIRAGPLGGPGAVSVLVPLASALDALHAAGLVHRDVKPENVVLAARATGEVPTLVDFGLARTVAIAAPVEGRPTRAGELFGTPEYMAPEQAAGLPPAPSWDLFAFAVLAFEVVTGTLPSDERLRELPARLGNCFARALADDPAERPRGAAAFVAALGAALEPADAGR